MNDHKTSTPTLVSALRILAGEIQSDDGVANMTIAEAADRIEELVEYYGEALALERNRAEQAEQRVAELVEQLKAYGKYAHDTTLEDQNAELVATLRDVADSPNTIISEALYHRIDTLLASAESAEPAKHCKDCAPEFRCFDGSDPCCKKPLVKSTPAKHPDTELLDWLFGNAIIAGPDGHVIDCRDDTDAARKQGGAT